MVIGSPVGRPIAATQDGRARARFARPARARARRRRAALESEPCSSWLGTFGDVAASDDARSAKSGARGAAAAPGAWTAPMISLLSIWSQPRRSMPTSRRSPRLPRRTRTPPLDRRRSPSSSNGHWGGRAAQARVARRTATVTAGMVAGERGPPAASSKWSGSIPVSVPVAPALAGRATHGRATATDRSGTDPGRVRSAAAAQASSVDSSTARSRRGRTQRRAVPITQPL